MAIANENFNVGGTGGALFTSPAAAAQGGAKRGPRPGEEAVGDDYKPPPGLPGWKQPSYDDDDRIDLALLLRHMDRQVSTFADERRPASHIRRDAIRARVVIEHVALLKSSR